MKNIKFSGNITTVSPICVTLPHQTSIPKNTHSASYIPSTSIRGMLRSMATFAICKLLKQHETELPLDTIYMLSSGVDTGRKIKLGGGYETLGKNKSIREANPQVSNFGNFAMAGKLKMGNAYCDPNLNPIIRYGNGSRNHPFNRNPDLFNFVKPDEVEYLQAIMEADALTSLETADLKDELTKIKAKLKLASGAEKKELFAQKTEIESKITDAKQGRTGSSESILRPLDGFEAIDLGYVLDHKFLLTDPSDMEFQFLLWIFYKASVNFRIGGHQNLGCGEISAHWEITESSFENPEPKKIGTLTMNEDGFKLEGIEFNPKVIEDAIIQKTFDFTVY
ncbi:hypothetical protein A7M79_00540 [Acinetobacter baumannii]|uniref:RAMP superfamily CRISPR-associated protein n=1 Tax=Acinetobacter baumannii TaxID=470 RepID=UPI0008DD561A|nr:RAMP superfamily CRISPR-associated protein [Acinetobacter baumannii]OIH12012.1 hypothetical protein A7M79_00540 [Acinetobacter baumannii]